MPLIQKKLILKDFESHKLRYTMKHELYIYIYILFIWINNSISHFFNVIFNPIIYNW
jgi:hypothetical protein